MGDVISNLRKGTYEDKKINKYENKSMINLKTID